MRLNQRKKPLLEPCSPFLTGLSSVAHSAGVSTIATITDRIMAETLGSIGGPAARLAQDCIKSVEVLEYPELGMEAIWKIDVQDFPAFIVVDDKGNDFYAEVAKPVAMSITRRPGL